MGNSITYAEPHDNFIKENYLHRPLMHICREVGINVKTGERILRKLKLVRPPELCLKFKSTHRGINEPKPKPKKYYEPKVKEKLQKIKKPPNEEKVFETKSADYSQKVLVKIDNKTWVYRYKK